MPNPSALRFFLLWLKQFRQDRPFFNEETAMLGAIRFCKATKNPNGTVTLFKGDTYTIDQLEDALDALTLAPTNASQTT